MFSIMWHKFQVSWTSYQEPQPLFLKSISFSFLYACTYSSIGYIFCMLEFFVDHANVLKFYSWWDLHVNAFFFFNFVSMVKLLLVFNKKISLAYFLIQSIHKYETFSNLWLVRILCWRNLMSLFQQVNTGRSSI